MLELLLFNGMGKERCNTVVALIIVTLLVTTLLYFARRRETAER